MGSLGGHLIPGSFFIMFGIWWGFITAIRYTQSKLKSPLKKGKLIGYHTSVTMPCICLPGRRLKRAPIESFLKVILVSIALFIEAYTGFYHYEVHVPIKSTSSSNSIEAANSNLNHQVTTLAAIIASDAHMGEHGEHSEHNHMGHSEHDHGKRQVHESNLPYNAVKKWSIVNGNQQVCIFFLNEN